PPLRRGGAAKRSVLDSRICFQDRPRAHRTLHPSNASPACGGGRARRRAGGGTTTCPAPPNACSWPLRACGRTLMPRRAPILSFPRKRGKGRGGEARRQEVDGPTFCLRVQHHTSFPMHTLNGESTYSPKRGISSKPARR